MPVSPFPEHLRAEYDAQLFNVGTRQQKARQLQSALQQAKMWHSPRRILDVGCGTGLILANLNGSVSHKVGCDVRRELFVPTANVSYAQARANDLPFRPMTFDLVICLAVIEEIEDWLGALQAMAQCVAEGGVLYITMTNGRRLAQWYRLGNLFGIRVSDAAWHYVRSSVRFSFERVQHGFDLGALEGWEYTNMTPYLGRTVYPVLRMLPLGVAAVLLDAAAPSLAYAWRKPVALTQHGSEELL